MPRRYRPNVAAILLRSDGKVLIARRSDYPESWQFPQGGVGEGENLPEALRREVAEEIALPADAYTLGEARGGYRYDFPGGPDKRGFIGQDQTYFLCQLAEGAESRIDAAGACGEFTEVGWADVHNFPYELVPPMKEPVYRRVMRDFFGAASE